jgi:hypothetical protein
MHKLISARSVIWLVTSSAVLIWWIALYGLNEEIPGTAKAEATIYVVIAMSVLAFPIGLIWAIVLAVMLSAISQSQSAWSGVLLYWAVAVSLGYVQWFIAIPIIREKRTKRAEKPAP